ncbi:hypothetical protein PRZ48_006726 [Zasmidium cellare]|uniref:Epoxide hydrolase N-terminal domain-containing protein n=1 Tax=Zasmidium cellare TaxID=395010 RepID=A0ABR0EQ18_ZASCE|nr:hypothetical protein PRZ48_006726 [Zasmidium cellare]
MAQPQEFGSLPPKTTSNIKPFQLAIPETEVNDMKSLLKLSRLAGPVYENSLPGGKSHLGVRRDWLADAKRVWENDFDWRATEAHINTFPNFKATVDDEIAAFEIHFAALFSSRADAIPVILLHGWPGSFLEFLPLLQLMKQKYSPETLPYHLVVPSLPGFTLSEMPLLDRDISQVDVARILNGLMINIGFGSGYVCQGGDIGSRVARLLAVNHSEAKAVHLNFCLIGKPSSVTDVGALSELEQQGLKRGDIWKASGNAYALEQATRPSTIGFVLSSNPLALLACNLWSYRRSFGPGPLMTQDDPKYHIKVPFGFSYYPKETAPTPISWVATTGNLVFSRTHQKGGHFAALERPKEFMEDLEEFIKQVW